MKRIMEWFDRLENNGVSYREALQYCGIDFPDAVHRQTTIHF
jgi:hypothetical protein